MSKIKTDLGVSGLTQVQLDRIALEQTGVVGVLENHPDGLVKDEGVTSLLLPGDWRALWVGGYSKPTQGKLVLKGTTPRTHALLKKGAINRWKEFGLTGTQADRLWRMKCNQKFELAKAAAPILNNPTQLALWLNHPREFGKGTKRSVWFGFASDLLLETYPAPFETELAKVIYELAGKTE
jgi:hypothetical protein